MCVRNSQYPQSRTFENVKIFYWEKEQLNNVVHSYMYSFLLYCSNYVPLLKLNNVICVSNLLKIYVMLKNVTYTNYVLLNDR